MRSVSKFISLLLIFNFLLMDISLAVETTPTPTGSATPTPTPTPTPEPTPEPPFPVNAIKCNQHSDCAGYKLILDGQERTLGCYDGEPEEESDNDDDKIFRLWGTRDEGQDCKIAGIPSSKSCGSNNCVKEECKVRGPGGNCWSHHWRCREQKYCNAAPAGEEAPDPILCEGEEEIPVKAAEKRMIGGKKVCVASDFKYLANIPTTENVGTFDANSCTLKINDEAYKKYVNNLYSLAAFEFMFANSTEEDCIDKKVANKAPRKALFDLANELKVKHAEIGNLFNTNFLEKFYTPSKYLQSSTATDKDRTCGNAFFTLANKELIELDKNMRLTDLYNAVPERIQKISNDYFSIDWGHRYSKGCRNNIFKKKGSKLWNSRMRFPDGINNDLLYFANNGDREGGVAASDNRETMGLGSIGAVGITAYLCPLCGAAALGVLGGLVSRNNFTFTDPIIPSVKTKGCSKEDVPRFKYFCRGGDHRRRCFKSDIDREVSENDGIPGMVAAFRCGLTEYYPPIKEEAEKFVSPISLTDEEVQKKMALMSFSHLYWWSATHGRAKHPVKKREMFFQILENNFYNLINYMSRVNELRINAADCLYQKGNEMYRTCQGDTTTPDAQNYDGVSASNGVRNAPGQWGLMSVSSFPVSQGGFQVPKFNSNYIQAKKFQSGLFGGNKTTSGTSGLSGLSESSSAAFNARKKMFDTAMSKMSDKEKNLMSGINNSINSRYSFSDKEISALKNGKSMYGNTTAGASINGGGANQAGFSGNGKLGGTSGAGSNSKNGQAGTSETDKNGNGIPDSEEAGVSNSELVSSNGVNGASSASNGLEGLFSEEGSGGSEDSTLYGGEAGKGSDKGIDYKALGLTEEDANSMLSETKSSKYKSSEDDGLFTIISKAYVREAYPRLLKKKVNLKTSTEEFSPTKRKVKKVSNNDEDMGELKSIQ